MELDTGKFQHFNLSTFNWVNFYNYLLSPIFYSVCNTFLRDTFHISMRYMYMVKIQMIFRHMYFNCCWQICFSQQEQLSLAQRIIGQIGWVQKSKHQETLQTFWSMRWSFSNCVNITRHCWNDVQINIKTIKKIMMILCSCPDRVSWVIHIKKNYRSIIDTCVLWGIWSEGREQNTSPASMLTICWPNWQFFLQRLTIVLEFDNCWQIWQFLINL